VPFATEEVWSWWQPGSIHRAPWPSRDELGQHADDRAVLETVVAVLTRVRKAKSDAQVSMKTPVEKLTVTDTFQTLEKLRAGLPDLQQAAKAQAVELSEAATPSVETTLEMA
jgi:valyl-tRNA synthetase